jgi:hypothetical protein
MAAAVGIGVMRQHVRGFLLVTFGAVVTRLGAGALGRVRFAAPQWKMQRSVGFIGGFAIGVIAGWPRNELAEAQFNKSEVLPY